MACLAEGLALVFDLDGVIVDSNPVHEAAWAQYLEACGIPAPPVLAERMYGKRNDDIVEAIFGSHLRAEEIHAHSAAKEVLYRRLMRPVLTERLVPGVAAFLEEYKRTPMGVASNAERQNIDFVLDTAGLRGYFQAVIDGHQVERPKPHPEIYLRTAERLGISPANCIVFEDSRTGVEAARAAGARVVAVKTTHAEFAGVDAAVSNFLEPELTAWLRAQKPA